MSERSSEPVRESGLSALSIRRHVAVMMLTLAVIVVGVFSLSRLPVDLLPAITYPRIGVRLDAPGVAPQVAESEITQPLEKALAATEGVVQIVSRTREGLVSIDLFFRPGGNLDRALNDATASVNRARNTLPDSVDAPRLFKFDPSQLPVYEFALTSASLRDVDLRIFADEELARELNVVPGVAGVNVAGGVAEEVRIQLDLARMQGLGVGLDQVLTALRQRNRDISGGRLLGQTREPLTRTLGRFQSASEIEDLSFPVAGNASRVYLRDFAEVIDGTSNQRVFVTLNQDPAVKVSIQKQPEANTISVVEGVRQQLASLKQRGLIPADMTVTVTTDESEFIESAISNVVSSGVMGTGLAALTVLLFLGSLRQTLIITLAIPLATLSAIILMSLTGLSLNVFSLGGLALGVGLVVDNSIVMLETVVDGSRLMLAQGFLARSQAGQQVWLAQAIRSSQSVESALIAATTTNLASVLPFLLIGGFLSLLFNELILTISYAVAASIVVAVTLVPMLASRLLMIPWSSRIGESFLLRGFSHQFERATVGYGRVLAKVLQFKFWVLLLAVGVLGGSSLFLAARIPQEILPQINTGQASLNVQFPAGTSLATNRQVMTEVDRILQAQPQTRYAFTTAGGSLFGTNVTANALRGSSTITLKPGSDVQGYVRRVNQALDKLNLAGIRLRLRPTQVRGLILTNSPVNGSDLDVILQGNDEQQLRQVGRQVLDALDEQVTTALFRPDAADPEPEIQIRPDWERLSRLGLTAQDVGETLQTAIDGSVPTQLQRGNRLVDIRVEWDPTAIQSVTQLSRIPLFTANRSLVRLSDVADLVEGQSPSEIQRINQRQVFLIAGNLEKGASLSQALAQVDQVLRGIELPPEVTLLPSAAAESNRQLQSALVVLGGLAVFMVFVVMAVQYNSLVDPLVIMLTVPMSLAGGLMGLYVTNTAIGATVVVGAVLLVGIVVNNAILMVELANQLREEEGLDRQTAILKAATLRLRSVVMITITTVLGGFPLAIGQGLGRGSEFLQPLGIVIFSGLILATVVMLFVIPCFYVLLHGFFGLFERSMPIVADPLPSSPLEVASRAAKS